MTSDSSASPQEAPPPRAVDLPRDLAALVGTVGTAVRREVRAEDVRRFLLATEPTARDAVTPVVAGDIVPPTYFCPDPVVAAESMGLPRPRPFRRTIDGGSEWDVRRAVRVGDVLTLVPRIAEVSGRRTGDGRVMVTTVMEVIGFDQDGGVVGVARGRCLSYEDAS